QDERDEQDGQNPARLFLCVSHPVYPVHPVKYPSPGAAVSPPSLGSLCADLKYVIGISNAST
ncbi:MAG: hypothetical protein ACREXP_30920, partial [Steroidobacteraceae bacterium]